MILFQGIFPSAEIIINSYDWLSVVSADKSILVDSSLTVLKISITGASAITDVDLYYSNGLSVIYGLTNVFNSNGNIKLRIGLSAW
jgi:hypothetical protein